MLKVLSKDIWREIGVKARRARNRQAAVAYVTQNLLHLSRGDVLVTDASEPVIGAGLTSAQLLQRLNRAGVSVFHCQGLHAKVALIDRFAVVGSANMSSSSVSRLVEAGLMTDQPSIVSAVASFIEQLKEQSVRLDQKHIDALCRIKVTRRGAMFGTTRKASVSKLGNNTWIIGVRELRNDPPPTELALIDLAAKELGQEADDLEWIRWGTKGKFSQECIAGDLVIQIWRSSGANRPSKVHAPTPVLLKQSDTNWRRFYLGDPTRKASELGWGQFQRLLKRLGYSRRVGPGSALLLTPELADAIDRSWAAAKRDR